MMKLILTIVIMLFTCLVFGQDRSKIEQIEYVFKVYPDPFKKRKSVEGIIKLKLKKDSLFWIDCSDIYTTPDSCFHEKPFKIYKKDNKIYVGWNDKSLIYLSLNKNDTVMSIMGPFCDSPDNSQDGTNTLVDTVTVKFNNRIEKCYVFTNTSYSIGKPYFIRTTVYLSIEHLIPIKGRAEHIYSFKDNRLFNEWKVKKIN